MKVEVGKDCVFSLKSLFAFMYKSNEYCKKLTVKTHIPLRLSSRIVLYPGTGIIYVMISNIPQLVYPALPNT
jgi:hypothetical protein